MLVFVRRRFAPIEKFRSARCYGLPTLAWPALARNKFAQLPGALIASNAIFVGRIRHRQYCNRNLPWRSK